MRLFCRNNELTGIEKMEYPTTKNPIYNNVRLINWLSSEIADRAEDIHCANYWGLESGYMSTREINNAKETIRRYRSIAETALDNLTATN